MRLSEIVRFMVAACLVFKRNCQIASQSGGIILHSPWQRVIQFLSILSSTWNYHCFFFFSFSPSNRYIEVFHCVFYNFSLSVLADRGRVSQAHLPAHEFVFSCIHSVLYLIYYGLYLNL